MRYVFVLFVSIPFKFTENDQNYSIHIPIWNPSIN